MSARTDAGSCPGAVSRPVSGDANVKGAPVRPPRMREATPRGPIARATSRGPRPACRAANASSRPRSATERAVTAIFTTSGCWAAIRAWIPSRSSGVPSKSCHERTSPRPAFAATTSANPARISTSTRSKPRPTASDRRRRRARWSRSGKRPPSDSGRQVKRMGFVRAFRRAARSRSRTKSARTSKRSATGASAAIRETTASVVSSVRLTAMAVLPPRSTKASPGFPEEAFSTGVRIPREPALWRRTPRGPPLRVPVMEHGPPAAHGSAAIGAKGRVRARCHVSADSQTHDFRGAAEGCQGESGWRGSGESQRTAPRLSAAPRAQPARTSLGQ